jgi:hypothetical protein
VGIIFELVELWIKLTIALVVLTLRLLPYVFKAILFLAMVLIAALLVVGVHISNAVKKDGVREVPGFGDTLREMRRGAGV